MENFLIAKYGIPFHIINKINQKKEKRKGNLNIKCRIDNLLKNVQNLILEVTFNFMSRFLIKFKFISLYV